MCLFWCRCRPNFSRVVLTIWDLIQTALKNSKPPKMISNIDSTRIKWPLTLISCLTSPKSRCRLRYSNHCRFTKNRTSCISSRSMHTYSKKRHDLKNQKRRVHRIACLRRYRLPCISCLGLRVTRITRKIASRRVSRSLWKCRLIARRTRRRCTRLKSRTIWKRCTRIIKSMTTKKLRISHASKARLYLRKLLSKTRLLKRSTISLTVITYRSHKSSDRMSSTLTVALLGFQRNLAALTSAKTECPSKKPPRRSFRRKRSKTAESHWSATLLRSAMRLRVPPKQSQIDWKPSSGWQRREKD